MPIPVGGSIVSISYVVRVYIMFKPADISAVITYLRNPKHSSFFDKFVLRKQKIVLPNTKTSSEFEVYGLLILLCLQGSGGLNGIAFGSVWTLSVRVSEPRGVWI